MKHCWNTNIGISFNLNAYHHHASCCTNNTHTHFATLFCYFTVCCTHPYSFISLFLELWILRIPSYYISYWTWPKLLHGYHIFSIFLCSSVFKILSSCYQYLIYNSRLNFEVKLLFSLLFYHSECLKSIYEIY